MDKIDCDYCLGYKCYFIYGSHNNICVGYNYNNKIQICNLEMMCSYTCPKCLGKGYVYWIDDLFNNNYRSLLPTKNEFLEQDRIFKEKE